MNISSSRNLLCARPSQEFCQSKRFILHTHTSTFHTLQLELSTELAGLGMTEELEGIDADEIERDIMDLGLGGSDSVSCCE